jgi:hypothetical protein
MRARHIADPCVSSGGRRGRVANLMAAPLYSTDPARRAGGDRPTGACVAPPVAVATRMCQQAVTRGNGRAGGAWNGHRDGRAGRAGILGSDFRPGAAIGNGAAQSHGQTFEKWLTGG